MQYKSIKSVMDIKNHTIVPIEMLEEAYKYLVLYGLLHGIGENDSYNTFLKRFEQLITTK